MAGTLSIEGIMRKRLERIRSDAFPAWLADRLKINPFRLDGGFGGFEGLIFLKVPKLNYVRDF